MLMLSTATQTLKCCVDLSIPVPVDPVALSIHFHLLPIRKFGRASQGAPKRRDHSAPLYFRPPAMPRAFCATQNTQSILTPPDFWDLTRAPPSSRVTFVGERYLTLLCPTVF